MKKSARYKSPDEEPRGEKDAWSKIDQPPKSLHKIPSDKLKPKKASPKKRFYMFSGTIFLCFLLLFIANFMSGGNKAPNNAQDTTSSKNESSKTKADQFSRIIIVNSENESILLKKHVINGDAMPIESSDILSPTVYDTAKDYSYVFSDEQNRIFYSKAEDKPTKIYESENTITDLFLDSNNSSLAMAEINGDKVVISEINDFSNPTPNKIIELESSQVIIEHWNGETDQLIIRKSCPGCSQNTAELISASRSGTQKSIFNPDSSLFSYSSGYSFDSSGEKALFITQSRYPSPNQFGILDGRDGPSGAPYSLNLLDVKSGESQIISTFGDPYDVASNGFFDPPAIAWVNQESIEKPIYSYLNKVYTQNNTKGFDLFYQTGQGSIRSILFADDNEIIVSSGTEANQSISYFNIKSQKGSIIFTSNKAITPLSLTFEKPISSPVKL